MDDFQHSQRQQILEENPILDSKQLEQETDKPEELLNEDDKATAKLDNEIMKQEEMIMNRKQMAGPQPSTSSVHKKHKKLEGN